MAINPELITTIRVDQLPDGTLNLTNKIPHTSGTVLEKASVQELVDLVATAIGVSGGVGYIAISVTDGQQLPDVPELPSFFLCGAGTFLNINGYPNIICTENLNAIMSLTDHWELAVEIPINPLSGTVQSVTGSAVDNTDPLNPVINEIIYGVQNIVAGTNITVDNTDPANPIVSATGGAGTPTLQEVATVGNTLTDTEIVFDSAFGNKEILMNVDDGIYVKDIDGDKLAFIEQSALGISNYDGTNTTYLLEEGFNHTSSGGFQKLTFDTIASDEEIIIPNASGTLALTSDITTPTLQQVTDEGLVDDQAVTTNAIKALGFDIHDGANNIDWRIGETDGGINVFDKDNLSDVVFSAQQDGNLSFGKGIKRGVFVTEANTAQRNYTFQDADGTIALLSDIPTLVAGTNITIDDTDPLNPIISSSGGGSGIPHATASGTDTYTATITGVAAYADADAYLIRFTNGNTTGATLNINALGAKTLYRNNDGALIGGDIINGGEMLCIYNTSLNGFQVIGTAPNSLFAYVTNDDSVTLTKGMPVYAFSGTGDRITVKRANNSTDATSAKTVGLVLSTSIAAGQKGLIMMQGLLDGLSILPTSTFADGDTVYLGATDGSITNVKPYAPNHLVYLGVVTTASNGSAGRMYVRVQNGYELSEIHDVDLITNAPTNNQVLTYESSTDLWKNKSLGTILGYTPYRNVQTSQTALTGTTAETIVFTATIPANAFNSVDVLKVLFGANKTTGLGAYTLRLRVNTTNTISGAPTIATYTGSASSQVNVMMRNYNLNGGNLYGLAGSASSLTDIVVSGSALGSNTLNPANTFYLFATVQLGNSGDSIIGNMFTIHN